MTLEEKVLRNDHDRNYSEYEIKRHLKNGVDVYMSYEEFERDYLEAFIEHEELPDLWEQLNKSVVDGVTYKYDIAP